MPTIEIDLEDLDSAIAEKLVGAVVRNGLIILSTYLITNLHVAPGLGESFVNATTELVIASVAGGIGLLWSGYEKVLTAKKISGLKTLVEKQE